MVCIIVWNYVYPNTIYRVIHPSKDTIVVGDNVAEAIELMGEPYVRAPNETGGQTLVYRTMIDWGKFVEFRTLIIETDGNGMIANVTSTNDD